MENKNMDETKNKKREKFIEEEKEGFEFKPVYLLPILAIVGLVFGLFFGSSIFSSTSKNSVNNEKNLDSILIPISEVNDGKAHFYTYASSVGKIIRFFVVKSGDGIFRAAFDACDVCFEAKKGYRQEGDYMVCNNCGKRFPSTRINEEVGGCNPSPVNREISNNEIVIKKADLEKGERLF